jgi:hypothetical protein
MPDIETIRGDSRIVGIPVFDADLDEYRLTGVDQTTNPTLADVDQIDYLVTEEPSSETSLIHKTDSDSAVTIVAADDINSVAFTDIPADAAVIQVKLEASDTQDLAATTLWHECQLTDINGNVTTIMRGDFEVVESATNPPN